MNETLKVIAERYSCRDFKDQMPSDEILQAIAEAGVQAPSGMNRQAWRVIVVKDKELINDMEAEGFARLAEMDDKTLYNRVIERGGRMFYGAPCMVVIPIAAGEDRLSLIDCGIVCQNITLAATSLGLGSLVCGLARLAFTDDRSAEKFSKRLGFPDGYVFGLSVLLGYANTTKPPHEPDKDKILFVE
jgi:nitroreductase